MSFFSKLLEQLSDGKDLSYDQAQAAMQWLISGQAASSEIAAFLVLLRSKGVKADELKAFRSAALSSAVTFPSFSDAVDIVGTGGDGLGTFNVSSLAAIVIAACGVTVVKHGSRAVSSPSGASDFYACLGVNLDLAPKAAARSAEELGLTFLFAPKFHPAFSNVAPVRAELKLSTVFNYLGPLCNPARPGATLYGVADPVIFQLYQEVLAAEQAAAIVVRGQDGLDEFTLTDDTQISEVCGDKRRRLTLSPEQLGLSRRNLEQLRGDGSKRNAQTARELLSDASTHPAIRDFVLVNAALGLTAYQLYKDPASFETDLASRIKAQLAAADYAITSGRALAKLDEWVAFTQKEVS